MSREEKPAENQEADQVETKPEDWVSLQMDDIEKQSEGEGTIAPPATAGGPSQGPRGERVLWAGDPASKRPFVVLEPKSDKGPSWFTRFVGRILNIWPWNANKISAVSGLDPWWLERTKPLVREIRSTVHGYPRLSTTIDSDANFMIYRRFGHLRTRVLMYHQDVLRELEAKLDDLDCEDYKTEGVKRAMCWRRGDDEQDPSGRKELLQSVNEELKVYDDLLFRAQKVYGFDSPTKRNQRSVTDMIWNDASLDIDDRDYIRHVDDLITLHANTDYNWVYDAVGSCFKWGGAGLAARCFRGEIQQKKAQGNPLRIELFQREVFGRFVEYLFAILSVILVLGPIYTLTSIPNAIQYTQLTVLICTGFFAFLLSSATAAKRHEVFAVTALYSAVLIICSS